MEFFQKGGGVPRQSKSFGTLLCTNHFGLLGRKRGGGWTKSRNFWSLFTLILVKYDQKSVPKVPKKKSAYEKVSQKFQKSGGEGGGG